MMKKIDHKVKEQIELLTKKILTVLEKPSTSEKYARTVCDLIKAEYALYQLAYMLPYSLNGLETADLPETDPEVDFKKIRETWNTGKN